MIKNGNPLFVRPHREYPPDAKVAIAKEGSSHPQLVGIAFKDMSRSERNKNFHWGIKNKKCTMCGAGGRFLSLCSLQALNMLKYISPKNGTCPFLEMPQEICNQIVENTVKELRSGNDDSDFFTFESGIPSIGPVFQLDKNIQLEALQIWLEKYTIALHSDEDVLAFQNLLTDH